MRQALFLDRDGIVNVDKNHVWRIEDIEFIDGVFDLGRVARSHGLEIFIITNQGGIARGKYSRADFDRLTRWMEARFQAEGCPTAATYHCPTHPDFPNPLLDASHIGWRKPEPGMLFAAAYDHGIDLGRSFLVGDRASDVEAGARAGVGRILLVGTAEAQPDRPVPQMDRVGSVRDSVAWLTALLSDRGRA
ncbi:MAG: HAD family hydrolase [Hyphomicrobiaceae bacterium]|nr:HAD family hydrolase [Hyphomicrobiaceae bacterium]